ncbi:MAG: serine/threonine-protein kinase, partial [Planctomycetota bacterium]
MPDPPDKSSDPPSADTFGSWVRMRPDTPTHPKKKPSGKTPSPGRPGDTELSGVAPTGGELVAPPDTPRPPETPPPPDTSQGDQTIVSKGPPLTTEVAYAGLRPKDLGRALIGQQIGDMLLEEFIGGGGMGAVFRAKDQSLDRTVAVKVLAVHEESDADTHKRFEIEGRSAARLDHPNIARIHYVGSDRGLRYIVFEYIAGVNVRDLVVTNGVLPVADAVSFALQITSALTHAWERGVVHRDIKPSNILITRSGQAKLVDMGLARMRR